MEIVVKILLPRKRSSVGKLADAELHFRGGDLDGMKLVGFAVWKQRGRDALDVTFPSRDFKIDGHRRRYALLRAIDHPGIQGHVRDSVLRAYTAFETAFRE